MEGQTVSGWLRKQAVEYVKNSAVVIHDNGTPFVPRQKHEGNGQEE